VQGCLQYELYTGRDGQRVADPGLKCSGQRRVQSRDVLWHHPAGDENGQQGFELQHGLAVQCIAGFGRVYPECE
jgi:hypothetical protein